MPRKTCCGETLLLALDSFVAWLSSTKPSSTASSRYPSASPRYPVPRSFQPKVISTQYLEAHPIVQVSTPLPAPVQPRRLMSTPPPKFAPRPIVSAQPPAPISQITTKPIILKPTSRYTAASNSLKKPKAAKVSRSHKAGLQFPVGRISRYMKQGEYAERIAASAPIFLAAVLEYLVAEILELAGNVAKENKKVRITPRHIQLAVRNDEELNGLIRSAVVASGVVTPSTRYELHESE